MVGSPRRSGWDYYTRLGGGGILVAGLSSVRFMFLAELIEFVFSFCHASKLQKIKLESKF